MVGNDIIDIEETKLSTNWERPGFVEKIFTEKEQAIIAAASDPFTTVWQMWSMKESAYKVFIQDGGERFYAPSKIECSFDNLENGEVKIDSLILKTSTLINDNYIFSTATHDNSNIESCVFEIPKNDIQLQSDFIRQQLIKEFSKVNNLETEDLKIRKAASGVPLIYYKHKALDISISMTHHGKFGGYSFEKVN